MDITLSHNLQVKKWNSPCLQCHVKSFFNSIWSFKLTCSMCQFHWGSLDVQHCSSPDNVVHIAYWQKINFIREPPSLQCSSCTKKYTEKTLSLQTKVFWLSNANKAKIKDISRNFVKSAMCQIKASGIHLILFHFTLIL